MKDPSMAALADRDAQYWMSGPSPADVDVARELLLKRPRFRHVRDQALALLETDGLSVVPVAVESLLAVRVMFVAAQMGIEPAAALAYLKPQGVVEAIRLESGASHAHAVRPARVPGQRAVPVAVAGQLVAALGQVAKFAAANDEARIADHAADLVSELGFALREVPDYAVSEIRAAAGMFAEAGVLLEDAAGRVEAKVWSSCTCGQVHGQDKADRAIVPAFRADARLAKAIAG
jgi:hypothetical protein